MIDGCLEWQRDGLNPPPAVREATAEYLEAEDAIATWLADCCTVEMNARESSTALWQSWAAWANLAKEPVGSQRAFSQKLEARFRPHRTSKLKGFAGLKIKENFEW
jgi:putative DNA primase/helicase